MALRNSLLGIVLVGLLVAIAVRYGAGSEDEALQPAGIESIQTSESTDRSSSEVTGLLTKEQRAAVGNPVSSDALEPTHRIFGRAVDEERLPVVDATVVFRRDSGDVSESTTTLDGRFEFLITRTEMSWSRDNSVTVGGSQDRWAVKSVSLVAAQDGEVRDVNVGTLVLAVAHALTVTVHKGDAIAPNSPIRVTTGHSRMFFGDYQTDQEGRFSFSSLPKGPVRLTAREEGFEGSAQVFVPESNEVTVHLKALGGADVFVVNSKSGEGIAGAILRVHESFKVPAPLPSEIRGTRVIGEYHSSKERTELEAVTDSDGRARIDGLVPGITYRLSATANDYRSFPRRPAAGARLTPGAELVRVEMDALEVRDIRWPVVAGESAIPPSGSPMQLRHTPGQFRRGSEPPLPMPGRMAGTMLVVERVAGRAGFIVKAPDGSLARVWAQEEETLGDPISFRRPRKIEVIAKDEEGSPIQGASAEARNQGNNPLCEPVLTDVNGIAVIEGLHGGLAEVHVEAPKGSILQGINAGTVNLDSGDGHLEATLTAQKTTRARLTISIDGTPRLPARFQVNRGNVLEEYPIRGELVLEVPKIEEGETASVWLIAAGFARASVKFEFAPEGSEPKAAIELVRTSVLIARVKPPEEGYVRIMPQRFDSDKGEWSQARELDIFNGWSYPNGPNGAYIFNGATPGQWRVIDERSGMTSASVQIRHGGTESVVHLDLSTIAWIEGRVEVDDPAQLKEVRVLVEGLNPERVSEWRPGSEPPEGAWLQDGAFRVCVPGDREVTLVPWHPWLVPDPESGRLKVRNGRDGVVLKLVQGDELYLPMPQMGEPRSFGVRIARFPNGARTDSEPLAWHYAPYSDGAVRCSMPRGRWTLLVDPKYDFTPLVLDDVEIEGLTELPTPQFEVGSTIRVRVRAPEGSDPPRIYVRAVRLAIPVYDRSINSGGEELVLLKGLGAGRYRLTMGVTMRREQFPAQEIDVDGSTDIELELDLR